MKKWMKNKLLTIITVIVVAGVGAGSLLNASKLESLFNPGKFKKFENRYRSDNYDYAAGDGDDMDLADEDKEGKGKEEEQQQVLQVSKPEEKEKKGENTLGIADNNKNSKSDKKNGVELTDSNKNSSKNNSKTGTNPNGKSNPNKGTNQKNNTDTGNNKDNNGDNPSDKPNNGSDNTSDKNDTNNNPGQDDSDKDNNDTNNPSDGDSGNNNKPDDNTSSGKDNTGDDDNKTSWEDEQLKPKDPVVTEDGTLTLLSVEMKRSEYARGDKFSAEDAVVTATFNNDGKKTNKTLSYGGSNGYSVALSTKKTGNQTAIFSYKGMTVRAAYKVLSNYVLLNYAAAYGSDWYISKFPGKPLESMDKDGYDALVAKVEFPNNTAVSGNIFNLSDVHKRMIAHLGDASIKEAFSSFEGQNYSTTVFLSEDADGYLTTMLEGYRYIYNKSLQDSRSYIYYPLDSNWDLTGRSLLDVVTEVPSGYKVRRVTENEGNLAKYTADQVLEAYTGSDTILTVPMGVTKVSLKAKSDQVTKIIIPQSVGSMDIQSVTENLPNLTEYATEESEKDLALAGYKILDGVLYSADGKTLLSVPSGKKKVTVPAIVTKLAKGCFAGMASNAVVTFEGENPPTVEGTTGYSGTLQMLSSDYDTVYKRYMFAFGDETNALTFEDMAGRSNLYIYKSKERILCDKEDESCLAAVSPDRTGEYTVSSEITSVGAGAFIDCSKLTDIIMGTKLTLLGENSLVVPDNIETITLQAEKTQLGSNVFGDPQKDAKVPSITVYVKSDVYDSYLADWTGILDPVYGENTAKNLLYKDNIQYVYEDGVKYQKLSGNNAYRLIAVYQKDKTALQVKAGTTQIASKAFSGCTSLEILSLPKSLTEVSDGLFTDCTALETVLCANGRMTVGTASGITEDVDVYTVGKEYASFEYEDGAIYGKNSAGERTILNVPTDYEGTFSVKENTVKYGDRAFKGCGEINTFVTKEAGKLKEIGAYCFEGSDSFVEFDFRDEPYLKTVGQGAFKDCHNLKLLMLPDSVTTISKQMCYNDNSLQNIGAEAVTTIEEEAFYSCDSLENELFDKVESIGDNAFYGCRMLRSVSLPETLTSLGESAFENCTLLGQAEINADIPGIPRYCFYGCRSLTKVTFDSSSRSAKNTLKVIGVDAFAQCGNLEKVDLSEFTSLTQIGEGAFSGDSSLINIKLPESLQKINNACFEGCGSLSILQLNAETVTGLGEKVFGDTLPEYLNIWVKESALSDYVESYTKILDPEYGEGTAKNLLGVVNNKVEIIKGVEFEITEEGRILKRASKNISGSYTVPEDTVAIADEAFMGCDKLTAITLPRGINLRLGDRCFKDCTGLQTIYIYSTITEWGDETFMNCTSAQKLYIGATELDPSIDRIGTRAFKNCTGLNAASSIEIHTVARAWGEECFAGCTNLPAFGISTQAKAQLEEIEDGVFRGCTSLTSSLTTKFTSLKKIGAYAFEGCKSLKQPSVPATVTSIGEGCFMNCDNLLYVSIYGAVEEYPKDCFKNCPKLIRTGGTAVAFGGLKRIGESAYEGCVSLTSSASWSIGRYRNLETIGANAFKGCKSIATGVVVNSDIKAYIYTTQLAASVTSVGAHAFDGCTGMSNLIFQSATPPSIGDMDISSMADGFEMDVPDSKADGDSIYKAYLEALTKVLGADKAYAVLDSISDGAKERYKEEQDKAKEPDKASESSTEKAEETSTGEEKSTEKSEESSTNGEKSTEKSEESSTGEEKSTEKSGDSSTSEEKSTEKSGDTSTSEKKSTEKSEDSSTSEEKSTGKSAKKSEEASTDAKGSVKKSEGSSTGEE